MNNRYLFRGKRVDNGEWVFGSAVYQPDGAVVIAPFDNYEAYAVIPETVTQYVGLKSVDGLDIYEGDFIKDQDRPYSGEVKFGHYEVMDGDAIRSHDAFGFYIDDKGFFGAVHLVQHGLYKIIGNRFENLELLEK